ncbi:MAG: hypothetical protein AAB417_01770 [Patescibacteria group bacterium]
MTMTKRALSILFLLIAFLAPITATAESGCPRGHMCWKGLRGQHGGGYTSRWSGGYDSGYSGYRNHDRAIVVERAERADPNIKVVRKPGLIDIPLGILGFGLGLVFGETKLVDTSCADDDVSCHRAEGRAEGRYDGKSAVADATEDRSYREAYDEAIRNSGQPVEAEPGLRESDLAPEGE